MSLRLYLYLALFLGVLAICAWGKLAYDAAEREKAKRVAAEQTAQVAQATTQIVERTFTNERTIYRTAEAKADAVQSVQGADAPVPPDVLSAWQSGVGGLRSPAPSGDDISPR